MKTILSELNLQYVYDNKEFCSLDDIEQKLKECNRNCWENEVVSYKKLRTYVIFKKTCIKEKYLSMILSSKERSLFAQYRLGVLPLILETGRYKGEKEEERICTLCCSREVENEKHFLLHCKLYEDERSDLLKKVANVCNNFTELSDDEKLIFLMNRMEKVTCKFIYQIFEKRKHTLYE